MDRHEIAYYDKAETWQPYAESRREERRARRFIQFIAEDVESIIDIGCGNGVITNLIRKPLVVGLDLARVPLREIRSHTVQGTVQALPVVAGSFDMAILSEVLEHLGPETYRKAIAEIQRLRARYLLISVPYDENLRLSLSKCSSCGATFNAFHHYRSFSGKWYDSLAPGYFAIKVEDYGFCTKPNMTLARIKYRLGVHHYSPQATCPFCGGSAERPWFVTWAAFRILDALCSVLKGVMGMHRPCCQMVLLKLKS